MQYGQWLGQVVLGSCEQYSHVGVAELPVVDLARFDLAECYLLLDVVEYHQEEFAFLRIFGVIVGQSDDRTVIFYNDGREFKWFLQFLE